MLRVAAFVDAGYLWKQIWKATHPKHTESTYSRANIEFNPTAFHDILIDYIAEAFKGIPFLRCYWYDGAMSNGGPSTEHTKVAMLNDFKLRLGSRVVNSDGRKNQKGVDGLIIADIISLAQNKAISHALLISGDGDMVPGVGVAQALGVRIHLLSMYTEQATSPNLKSEVDAKETWQTEKIQIFAKPRDIVLSPTCPDPTPVCPDNSHSAETTPSPSVSPSLQADPASGVAVVRLFESLSTEEKSSITPSYIPHDIDRRLIRAGYEDNSSKPLTEKQKRALRAHFREKLTSP